ncbi:MAG: DfrA [uncultured bacterium]|nr:MAG: DfrA [uncultured bacterium]OGT09705.1 MAG: hypothetical protein A2V89_03480 [Gammaproteobacteria bacterium RBG_16_37_9]HBC72132.1 dihydrofolate reductase [Coxiellaceae bacterium]HBS51376.1 dihydrofolate reductase [Coxiellaceae bacterium]HBY55434.1 dihydrofolate reductase [Coxiellaceae bacterium]
MPFSIIAAIATNNVIGKNNKLPWDIPEDSEYFYKIINGKPVIMGRKTYESIGGAIKNSQNIVLSHNHLLQLPACIVMHSISEVLDLYQDSTEEVMVIGGTDIYREFLPFVDRMYLTFIHSDVDGDVYFPKWQKDEWVVTDKRDSKSSLYSYSFVVLQRK